MIVRLVCALLIAWVACGQACAAGKIAGDAGGEIAVYSSTKGLQGWAIAGGRFEFSVPAGEYMMACGGRLVPYVRVRDGETTWVNHSEEPGHSFEAEMWTPAYKSFGQSFVASGEGLMGVWFWMPGGTSRLTLTLREDGPEGKLVGAYPTDGEWFSGVPLDPKSFPTQPGQTYYVEIASTDDAEWNIGMPRGPDPYPGGIAFFGRVPHPESDLGITIREQRPDVVRVASARVDQHFIEKGPGSGSCIVAGQTFVAKNAANILYLSANCGFGGGVADFDFALREGGPEGRLVTSKAVRMVSDWGSAACFQPDELPLVPGATYCFEYRRTDGKMFYSYLSADVYPDGKAYRRRDANAADGKEVEGFDQFFEVVGETVPGSITYPYNVVVSNVTSASAGITWETGTPADGIVYYGVDRLLGQSVQAGTDRTTGHSAVLSGLSPGTVYYYRVGSWTGKEGSSRSHSRIESFLTAPVIEDRPQFDRPPDPAPVPPSGPVVNGGFEDGLRAWQRLSWAKPAKESKEHPLGGGPFGSASVGADGYMAHSGTKLYGWRHLAAEDPNPDFPREDWMHEVISQKIKVRPGGRYVLKGWFLTGERGTAWGRDSRIALVVDTKNQGLLDRVDSSSGALSTQWFATQNEWKQASLRFTAESDTVAVGVHLLQWWTLEANYLYVDDISVEEE